MFDTPELTERARELRSAFTDLCADLDPESVPLPEAPALWSCFERIERLAAGAKCRLARRVDESRAWQRAGDRSAADWMARQSGRSTGRTRAELETSRKLRKLPTTERAVAQGLLSEQQADAIADAAAVEPSAEARLLGLASRASVKDLRDACGRAKAEAEDDAARARRLHAQRSARTWAGSDGSWNLHVRHTPEVGARIEALIARVKERIFQAARIAGEHEGAECYAADAVTQLLLGDQPATRDPGAVPSTSRLASACAEAVTRRGESVAAPNDQAATGQGPADTTRSGSTPAPRTSRRPDTKVIVLIDYEALRRGHAEAGETCEIAGVGPVPVATVRGLLADSFGAALVKDGVEVRTVAHLGRSPTAHQRTALEARGYRCEVPGCGSTSALEIDHVTDWSRSHRTSLDQLAWLCRRHHRLKTHDGWRLEGLPGRRTWRQPAAADPSGEASSDGEQRARAGALFDNSPAA